MSFDMELLNDAKAWPFQEAKALIKRLEQQKHDKAKPVIFETGFGASGLPHIGTFGEVARTSMVRHAFHELTKGDYSSRLIVFSDDMDGLRRVPGNVPNQERLAEDLGKPVTKVFDPFEKYESFAHHNNAKMREFLDSFGFEYEFISSTEHYESGAFDDVLMTMLERLDKVLGVILPTLGQERQETYSPFLPISPTTGRVLQVPTLEHDAKKGEITFKDEDGEVKTTSVKGGKVKIQWKADWAVRWTGLGVDYEMSGKDLIDSVKISGKLTRILGGTPPAGFNYELFLDDEGQRISKSKGNGIAVEDWLKYAPSESLALYMYQKPKTAKRLYFDVIPKAVDEYQTFLANFPDEAPERQIENPVWHLHAGDPPLANKSPISFALLLNLVSAANAESKEVLWGFISRYAPEASPATHEMLDRLAGHALEYYEDFVKPNKAYRAPSDLERRAMMVLAAKLKELPADAAPEEVQTEVYTIGKEFEFENLRDWFKALYEVLLGQSQGPRFGGFAALYGLEATAGLIEKTLVQA